MKQGDIYLVQWDPSVGHEFQKARPAVILSSKNHIQTSELATVMPLTSRLDTPIQDDILVLKDQLNRLANDSLIKVHHLSSFDKSRMIRHIGIVSEDILSQIKLYLYKHFDMSLE